MYYLSSKQLKNKSFLPGFIPGSFFAGTLSIIVKMNINFAIDENVKTYSAGESFNTPRRNGGWRFYDGLVDNVVGCYRYVIAFLANIAT